MPYFALPTGVWSSVVIVKTTNQVSTFVNGSLFDAEARAPIEYGGGEGLSFTVGSYAGGSQWLTRFFRGSIGRYRIYSRALSASEVRRTISRRIVVFTRATADHHDTAAESDGTVGARRGLSALWRPGPSH